MPFQFDSRKLGKGELFSQIYNRYRSILEHNIDNQRYEFKLITRDNYMERYNALERFGKEVFGW